MPRLSSTRSAEPAFSFERELKEMSKFFAGKDEVHKTLRRLIQRLNRSGIPYAIVGAMALGAHNYRRATKDVDILLSAAGFEEFVKRFVGKHYDRIPGRQRRFRDRTNGVGVDFLVTGRFPGTGQPGPIAYPDPAAVSQVMEDKCVVNLPTLVQLKLAARRHKDFGDVVGLIQANEMD